ncbi:MAG: Tim44/TimA family putative adaptor protein [Alphaproteobacteria bacterium]
MAADLIIYAVIAAGLIFWLRGILGTRHGDERERPSPFTARPEMPGTPPSVAAATTLEEKYADLGRNKDRVGIIENKTAENALLDIAKLDKSFDIDFFLQAAQDSFVMIVEAFSAGDRETLRDLLTDTVYKIFDGAITAREQTGEKQFTEIQAVRKAEVIEAKLQGKTAFVTLRFRADEVSWTKNIAGDIIAGHEARTTEMRDIWTFTRDLRGKDPRWLISETRGGFEGDNDLVPNS